MPKTKRPSRKKSDTPQSAPKRGRVLSRREALGSLGVYAIGGAAMAGGAAYLVSDVRQTMVEGDLSQIGQGTPTIVQIHDPACQLCQALQRETRAALKDCEEGYTYLVANIKTPEGRSFAGRMGQPHVTLALLDGHGTPLHFINGVTPAETLKASFERHFG